MAILFDGAGKYLSWTGGGSVFEPNNVGTVCFWAYPITDSGAAYSSMVTWNYTELDQRQSTTPDVWRVVVDGTGTSGSNGFSYNTWYFCAMIRASKTDFKFYVDAVEEISVTTDVTAVSGQNRMQIGTFASGTQPFGGRIANLIAWETALSENALAAQKRQLAPVQWGDIWCWLRMQSGALGVDSSGQGNTFTATGSPSYVADPTIPLTLDEDELLLLL